MVSQSIASPGFPGALMTSATKVCRNVDCMADFVMRFSTFDETSKHFVYTPSGTVRAIWSYFYTPLSCTGTANEARALATGQGNSGSMASSTITTRRST